MGVACSRRWRAPRGPTSEGILSCESGAPKGGEPDAKRRRQEAEAPQQTGELNAEIAALLDAAVAAVREQWRSAGGPPFGHCAICYLRVASPVVLACGHIVCSDHVQGRGGACRWAPACAEQSFPNPNGARTALAVSSVVKSLLDHGVESAAPTRTQPAVRSGDGDTSLEVARAAVLDAQSPLEAIEAYRTLAKAAQAVEERALAALANAQAVRLWEAFVIPAPAMATRFDHMRHGAAFQRAVCDNAYGRCPAEFRSKAVAAVAELRLPAQELAACTEVLPVPRTAPAEQSIVAGTSASEWAASAEGDFECAVCYGTLYEPVTVACGHCFCRRCLARQLDFERGCPLCREPLSGFVDQYPVTAGLGCAIEAVLPGSAAQGQVAVQKEVDDMKEWLPIFVCMLAFPTQACPLHIFEPRYRLMMRRAVSSGLRRFGMCVPMSGPPDLVQNGYSKVGTVLFIREIRMLADGRSLVDCVGETRFRVRECSERDGYNVARVDLIEETDQPPEELVASCRSALAKLRALLRERAGFRRQREAADPEEDDAFFWHAIEYLPIHDKFKISALITEGRTKRFKLLQNLLEASVEGLLAKTPEGGGAGQGQRAGAGSEPQSEAEESQQAATSEPEDADVDN